MTDINNLPSVRIALPIEEDEIMELCRELHDENGLFTMDEDRVRATLRKCFNRQGAIVGVIGNTGQLEAATCIVFSEYWYSSELHLSELFNFVRKPYRKSRNAESLIEFGKMCADRIGIPFITGIITNKQMAPKVRLYQRRLGTPAGAWFVYPQSAWKAEHEPTVEDFFIPFESRSAKRKRERQENGSDPTIPMQMANGTALLA